MSSLPGPSSRFDLLKVDLLAYHFDCPNPPRAICNLGQDLTKRRLFWKVLSLAFLSMFRSFSDAT